MKCQEGKLRMMREFVSEKVIFKLTPVGGETIRSERILGKGFEERLCVECLGNSRRAGRLAGQWRGSKLRGKASDHTGPYWSKWGLCLFSA